MKNWKYINGAEIGNAFDFETQKVVDAKDWLKQAEENLRKAELDVKKNPGDKFFLEQLNAEKRSVERAKENLARAQRAKAGNETMHEWATSKPRNVGNAGFDLREPDPTGIIEAKAREAAQKQQNKEEKN